MQHDLLVSISVYCRSNNLAVPSLVPRLSRAPAQKRVWPLCSHIFRSGFPYCQPDHGSTHYYCSSRANAGAPIDAPITKQTVSSLKAVFSSDAGILEPKQRPQSLREQYPGRTSRGTRVLVHYCNTLLHHHTRTLTTPRDALTDFAVHIKY